MNIALRALVQDLLLLKRAINVQMYCVPQQVHHLLINCLALWDVGHIS